MTTNRNTHCLRRVNGSKQPTQIAGLAAKIERDGDLDSGTWREYTCHKATVVSQRRVNGKVSPTRTYSGTPEGACKHIARLARGNRSLWVFACDLYRTLTAIGLLDRIGTDFLLRQEPQEQNKEYGVPARGKFNGFAVLEPHSGILVVRVPDGGTVTFVDLGNYCTSSVVELVKTMSPADDVTDINIQAAVIGAWADWYIDWLTEHGLGPIKHTLASQSQYAWRKNWMDRPVVVVDNKSWVEFERAALYGGRCEVYHMGKLVADKCDAMTLGYYGGKVPTICTHGPIAHLDANSLYAGVSVGQLTPAYPATKAEMNSDRHSGTKLLYVADVTVEISQPKLPVVTSDGITIWPTGRLRGTWCWPEIELLSADEVIQTHRVQGYVGCDLFTEYVTWLHDQRLKFLRDGHATGAKLIKRWLHTFFGKFAQVSRGWQHEPTAVSPSPWAVWHRKKKDGPGLDTFRSIGGRVERHVRSGEPPESIPVITAWVYSLAREWMWMIQQLAGRDHVYYCDTDSIFTDTVGMDRLQEGGMLSSTDLGKLRVVAVHDTVEFIGIKHYVCDGKVTCAGLMPERVDMAMHKGTVYVPEPLTTAAQAGRSPSRVEHPQKGVRHQQYRHGVVTESGWVKPHVVGMKGN